MTTMRLTSSAFSDREKIPIRFTCDGADVSPPLAWWDAPTEARSFAIVCVDPDAPSGNWYHWAVYDIPDDITHLPEHYPPDGRVPSQALNDFGKKGYGGPCPPHGHGTHHYHFKLFALNVEHLPLPVAPRCREVENMARAQAIATADLIGTYSR
jgi:Raf kinase inhibitor-like YbhB/YbcL family protein